MASTEDDKEKGEGVRQRERSKKSVVAEEIRLLDDVELPILTQCLTYCGGAFAFLTAICMIFVCVLFISYLSSFVEQIQNPYAVVAEAWYNSTVSNVQNPGVLSGSCMLGGYQTCVGDLGSPSIQQIP